VYDDLLVEQARAKVTNQLMDDGYDEVVRKDDYTIYRHELPYMGEVRVYDDGWMMVKRQKLQIEGREMPWAKKNSPLAWAGCVVWMPLCVRPAGQTLSKRRFRGTETEVVHGTQPGVAVWSERIADQATHKAVEQLPQELQALWDVGTPLVSDHPLPSYAERRHELLLYWDSRTDTPWGEMVRASVESFCRGVVQHDDAPFTAAEIAEFNQGRTAYREFTLQRQPVAGP